MINCVTTDVREEQKIPSLPCIMQSKRNPETLVLFISPDVGVVLGHNPITINRLYQGWFPYDDKEQWQPYKGKVILENKDE